VTRPAYLAPVWLRPLQLDVCALDQNQAHGDEVVGQRPDDGVAGPRTPCQSRLFLRQVALFEEEVGVPSGIGPMEADEAEVSLASFGAFVSALLSRQIRGAVWSAGVLTGRPPRRRARR
jgi:hypothetical protein